MTALQPIPDEPVPCIGYVRVSMKREEMISPEIQQAAISDWARRMGRQVVDWVTDLDTTGRNFRRRVMRGIERIEHGEATEIAVYRFDRWGRNALESLANIRRVELAGGQVCSATEPLDAESAIGKYNRHNAFGLAEMQSDIIGENWRATLKHRVENKLPPSGTARFGYVRLGRARDPVDPHRTRRDPNDNQGERYEPDFAEGTADVLVAMYDKYIAGNGFTSVAVWLNARAIPNTRGAKWSDTTVANVLDSGFAAGYLRVHDASCRCRKPSDCSRRMYVAGAQEPVLDMETWEKYRRVRQERTRQPPRARYPQYPLTGLIRCGHCKSAMTIQSIAGKPGYGYRCKRWHHHRDCDGPFPRRAHVEKEVLRKLAEWADDVDERAAIVKARKGARVTAEVDEDRLTKALADNDAALRRLAVQKAQDGEKMPPGVYEDAREELLTTRAEIEEELGKTRRNVQANTDDHVPVAIGLLEEWDTLPPTTRRDLLAKLIRHVEVYRMPRGEAPWVEVTPVWAPEEQSKDCLSR